MADMLLDTAVLDDYRRGDPGAREIIERVMDGTVTASISPFSLFELWSAPGFDRRTEIGLIAVLRFLEVAPLSEDAARAAGIAIGGADPAQRDRLGRFALIGATARDRGEPVCTREADTFERFCSEIVGY